MKLNIGYFADGPWAHRTIKKILDNPKIIVSFICLRYDSEDKILRDYAKEYNIKVLKHRNINSNKFISLIKKYNCDLFVSMSFNQIFKSKIINLAKYKIINCHAGKLPFYRGRNVLNWALINDEKEFGITVHYVDELIDNGDIILQKTYKITDNDDYYTILQKAYLGCSEILYKVIKMFFKGPVIGQKQKNIHPIGFYCTKRKLGDEILNWDTESRHIFNFVRAISSPGPSARTFLKNREMKIHKVKIIKDAPIYKCIPGVVLKKNKKDLIIKTKDSSINIISYEYDGDIKVVDRFNIK